MVTTEVLWRRAARSCVAEFWRASHGSTARSVLQHASCLDASGPSLESYHPNLDGIEGNSTAKRQHSESPGGLPSIHHP